MPVRLAYVIQHAGLGTIVAGIVGDALGDHRVLLFRASGVYWDVLLLQTIYYRATAGS